MELALKIGKNNSYISFIVPNNLLLQKYGRKLRKIILDSSSIKSIVDLGFEAFKETVVPTTIIVMKKSKKANNKIYFATTPKNPKLLYLCRNTIEQKDFMNNDDYQFNLQITGDIKNLLNKIYNQSDLLSDIVEIKIGIEGAQKYITKSPVSDISKPLVRGKNFNRYFIDFMADPKYIVYDRKLLHRPREERLFTAPRKILIRQTGDRVIATIDEQQLYAWKSVFVLLADENNYALEYILALINSKMYDFFYKIIP
jgi:hypothetical protein